MKTKVAVKSSFANNERESSKTSHIHSHEHKSWSAKNERMQIVYEAKRIKQERITLSETLIEGSVLKLKRTGFGNKISRNIRKDKKQYAMKACNLIEYLKLQGQDREMFTEIRM